MSSLKMFPNFAKRLKFFRGPMFSVGQSVVILDSSYLKLPRKITIIGWNNAESTFFYGVEGMKNTLFLQKELMDHELAKQTILKHSRLYR